MSRFTLNEVRSEALFASRLQHSEDPSQVEVLLAIAEAVRCYGSRGCAARMAQEFGDHPDTAVARMRWARQVVADVFPREPVRHTGPATAGRHRAGQRRFEARSPAGPRLTVPALTVSPALAA